MSIDHEQLREWADRSTEYWSQFDPSVRITTDMVDGQPMPPDDLVIDFAAALAHSLACALHWKRTGEHTAEPSVQARLDVADLLDKSTERAMAGASVEERYATTMSLWDKLIDEDE